VIPLSPLEGHAKSRTMSTSVSKDEFKKVMGSFAAGVTVVTTVDADGRKWGLTATAFSSLSMDPPLCLVCVGKGAGSHGPLSEGRKFAVNMLTSDQEELSNRFASRIDDKFEGVAHHAGEATGCPVLDDALASMECEVTDVHAGGDHDIFVGKLTSVTVSEGEPLLYWRGKYAGVAQR
jgi:flavin reductase (DIM6/NTAB) family NADH-FMN oxidoreductase RutF